MSRHRSITSSGPPPPMLPMSSSMSHVLALLALVVVVRCVDSFSSTNEIPILTSAVIRVAYDGTFFRGWKASNNAVRESKVDEANAKHRPSSLSRQNETRRQSRRSRTLQRKGAGYGKVRTVEGVIRANLKKVYGNVDEQQIIIDACSRTDSGVHALSLIAQFRCKKACSSSSEDGPEDSENLIPLPFGSNLSKLCFVLNRMLPPDVRVVAASPTPIMHAQQFHPTLHAASKTYVYRFAIGNTHDPIQAPYVWQLDGSSGRAVGMNGRNFCLETAMEAARLFDSNFKHIGEVPAKDYGDFRSAFRGTDRGRVQSPMCRILSCKLIEEKHEQLPSWESTTATEISGSRLDRDACRLTECPRTFAVNITGDRFLYKMVRNIVGSIVAAACGHMDVEDIRRAIEMTGERNGGAKVRRICAPARGLKLVEVSYPDTAVKFDWHSG